MRRCLVVRLLLLAVFASSTAAADSIPGGFEEVPGSRSADRRLGAIWPDAAHVVAGVTQNQLVELGSGRVIATLGSETVFAHQNHTTAAPRWTRDGSFVWYVDGKWGSLALEVVRIERGKVSWQIDVRERVVADVVKAVQRAVPRAAAIAKQQGQGSGSWYREGLAIEVRPTNQAFPLTFEIQLTSDPKCLEGYPKAGQLAYRATARLDATGTLVVGALRVRARPCGSTPKEPTSAARD